jgi:hypothetical protein
MCAHRLVVGKITLAFSLSLSLSLLLTVPFIQVRFESVISASFIDTGAQATEQDFEETPDALVFELSTGEVCSYPPVLGRSAYIHIHKYFTHTKSSL